jgi:transcriptional antiterminator RfaH
MKSSLKSKCHCLKVVDTFRPEGGRERWFAVRTKPRSEDLADHHLRRQAYETFYPRIPRHVKHARKTILRYQALFPGYVFVRIDASHQRWRPVDSTLGVASIVKFAGAPAPLATGLVEALMARASDTGEIRLLGPDFAPGQKVRVISGAFSEWIGTVLDLPAADRVALLTGMMGRSVKLTLPRSAVILCRDEACALPASPIARAS